MNQKVEELLIELSMLKDDLHDTENMIKEKKEELRETCPHDKLIKLWWAKEEKVGMLELDRFVLKPCPKFNKQKSTTRGSIIYRCLTCMAEMVRNEEDPELERKVVSKEKKELE